MNLVSVALSETGELSVTFMQSGRRRTVAIQVPFKGDIDSDPEANEARVNAEIARLYPNISDYVRVRATENRRIVDHGRGDVREEFEWSWRAEASSEIRERTGPGGITP